MFLAHCDKCKEDIERMRLGYNSHNGDCGKWQCHVLDTFDLIIGLLLVIPLLLIVIPFAIILNIFERIIK